MSNISADYKNNDVSDWIMIFSYFHERGHGINQRELNEAIPQYLLQTLESDDHLSILVYRLVNAGYLDERADSFQISDKGIFAFRKYLQPLIENARQHQDINKIFDSIQGDKKIKDGLRDFFKDNSNLPQDEFNEKLKNLLWNLGKEGLFFVFRLMMHN